MSTYQELRDAAKAAQERAKTTREAVTAAFLRDVKERSPESRAAYVEAENAAALAMGDVIRIVAKRDAALFSGGIQEFQRSVAETQRQRKGT